MSVNHWDSRFMRIAREVATWSKDPSTRVGAIMVRDRRVIATGYNGFPQGIEDNGRLHNREEKYPLILHAEENVLMNALQHGVSAVGSTLYVWPLPICNICMRLVIQAGVKRVVIMDPADGPVLWRDKWFNHSLPMVFEAKIMDDYLSESDLG